MNIKILEEKDNSLLNRKEYSFEIESPDKTPSNEELKKQLISLLKTKENLIIIKNINQVFGRKTSKALVYVYKDEKTLKETEPKQKEKKEKPKEGEAQKQEAYKPEEKQPKKTKEPEAPKEQEKAQVEKPKEETK